MTDTIPKKRGRPTKNLQDFDTRTLLIRTGIALLTERGYITSDIDSILKTAGVPKGSFYHYFKNKEEFGKAVIEGYASYFNRKLDRFFQDEMLSPLSRLNAFYQNACEGMEKFNFTRGCLVGNVAQESTILPESYHILLNKIFIQWQDKITQLFELAKQQGELAKDSDCTTLANVFWIGWEGAIMRAKLEKSCEPLTIFVHYFLSSIGR